MSSITCADPVNDNSESSEISKISGFIVEGYSAFTAYASVCCAAVLSSGKNFPQSSNPLGNSVRVALK